MHAITHHTGLLTDIERLPSSSSGNPRYRCRIDGWTCQTPPDSPYGYSLPNHAGKCVRAQIGTYYGKPTIHALWAA